MKNYIISFLVLFIIILSFILFNKNTEKTSPESFQKKFINSNINNVENKKPPMEIHFDKNEVPITKAPDDVAPVSELQDLITSTHVPSKYFHDWSDDEIIKDTLFDTWGKNLSETFFAEHDNKKLLDRSRSLSDENDFLLKFKKGIYRGYAFLMKKDGSYGPDPQPFITFLNTEKFKGRTILKVQWTSWKKATEAEGVPHPIWQNNFKSNFQEEEVYKNLISFSEEALGPMFLSYFGMKHSCKEGTMLISSKRFDSEKIEGNLYCRTSLHDFILIGLFSLSYVGVE